MKLFRLFVVACILTFCAGRAAAQEQETPAPKTYKIYAVCDAHLDTQWNWDLTHTIREYIPRILFQNLWMLERYPDYKFNFEGGIMASGIQVGNAVPVDLAKALLVPLREAALGVRANEGVSAAA